MIVGNYLPDIEGEIAKLNSLMPNNSFDADHPNAIQTHELGN
jgi:hypothetical protein